ncbi:hypothetical protein QOZ96_002186 [Brevundimonas nasdae]|uniref:hypothetical protein n=1 Tax=Brevundimonas nasdae TaxID=172043 RepID=UPI001912FF6B|nr:hypothetical protein [Brevundimonas nasdae]MBK6025604.1 hypothetical protein [Brevundimonas nasdae]MDQ0452236.1 hypothetical protein [Brevundimonas nasdae]
MSRHNITGSEAFKRGPSIAVRRYRPGGMRRKRARTTMTFIILGALAVLALIVAAVAALTPAVAA